MRNLPLLVLAMIITVSCATGYGYGTRGEYNWRYNPYYYEEYHYWGPIYWEWYGRWVWLPPFGRVWMPFVWEDWQPYRYGMWVWTERWGWLWVSFEPWAICYHYGRWLWTPMYGWVWIPGYVWAPHWVVWIEIHGYIGWAPMDPWGNPAGYYEYPGYPEHPVPPGWGVPFKTYEPSEEEIFEHGAWLFVEKTKFEKGELNPIPLPKVKSFIPTEELKHTVIRKEPTIKQVPEQLKFDAVKPKLPRKIKKFHQLLKQKVKLPEVPKGWRRPEELK